MLTAGPASWQKMGSSFEYDATVTGSGRFPRWIGLHTVPTPSDRH